MLSRLIGVSLCVVIAVLVGMLLFRPAALLGVDSKGLGNSVGGAVRHAEARCAKDASGRWLCTLRGATIGSAEYSVTTRDYGCWTGTRLRAARSVGQLPTTVSGCIGLTDLLGT